MEAIRKKENFLRKKIISKIGGYLKKVKLLKKKVYQKLEAI